MCVRLLLLAVALIVILAIGVGIAFASGAFKSPEVVSASHHWGEVNAESTTVITDVVIDNPNRVGFAVSKAQVEVDIELNGVLVGEGESEGIELGEGESENRIVTIFEHKQLPAWWAAHIQNNERTEWTVKAKLETSIFGWAVSVPVSEDSGVFETHIIEQLNSVDPAPLEFLGFSIDFMNPDFRWADVDDDGSTLAGSLSVNNQTPLSVEVAAADFFLTSNDVRVGQGQSTPNMFMDANAVTEIPLSFRVDHSALEEWWPTHIENSEQSLIHLEIGLTLAAQLPGPAGRQEIRLPVIKVSDELRTNLLEKTEVE